MNRPVSPIAGVKGSRNCTCSTRLRVATESRSMRRCDCALFASIILVPSLVEVVVCDTDVANRDGHAVRAVQRLVQSKEQSTESGHNQVQQPVH